MSAKETNFEKKVIEKLMRWYPDAIVLKIHPGLNPGFPDRLALIGSSWLAFEVKRSIDSAKRPNQDYYIDLLNQMSAASFVYPENQERFFDEVQRTFQFIRPSRFFKP